jgi:Secretion system C-terminal sorting domain/Immune inhibitor A-like, MAM domain/IPT/TIG domain
MVVALLTLVLLLIQAGMSQEGLPGREPRTSPRPIPSAPQLPPATPENTWQLPFFSDFEAGVSGWTLDGQFNLIQNAQNYSVLSPGINPSLVTLPDDGHLPSAYSGSRMCWFGQTTTGTFIGVGWDTIYQYPLNGGSSTEPQYGSLITPAIDLSSVSHAQLSFKTWWEIEGVDVDAYDVMQLEISTDNGLNFYPIGRGLINPLNDVDGESWKAYSSGGLGQVGVWLDQLFDLTPWVGNTVHIRFRFDTIDDLYNGFRGWFIDNVSVSDIPLPAPNIQSVQPSTAYPEELVNVTGQNFVNGAEVSVGGQVVSAIVSTSLAQFEVPYLTAGIYNVTLTNPDGQSDTEVNALTITYTFPPQIIYIFPDTAEIGTSVAVTVEGTDFDSTAVVDIGGIPLSNQTVVDYYTITGNSPSNLPAGFYNVTVTNSDGQYDILVLGFQVYDPTGIEEEPSTSLPAGFKLMQNYPNPFNPVTNIQFGLARTSYVKLEVYDLLGKKVASILENQLSAGYHSVRFDASSLAGGIYYYRLQTDDYVATKKFILTK